MTDHPHGKRILAVCSSGGHWMQMRRLLPALSGHRLALASVHPEDAGEVHQADTYVIRDASRWEPGGVLVVAWQIAGVLWRVRPEIIVSTGAAPGLFALALGKLTGARTAWIDSLANVERVSLSGRLARPFADLYLTQWEHLARPEGPAYEGRVL